MESDITMAGKSFSHATHAPRPATARGCGAAPTPETVAVSASAKLKKRWQLSGVAYRDGSSVLILRDRVEDTSRRINGDVDLDGWKVRDSGPDYAVFAQKGEEVRLVLNEDIGH